MNRKNIKLKLHEKFNDWVKSIDNVEVQSLVMKNSIVTGGCITSMLLNEPVNDYDIYFTNKETTFAVAKYYASKYPEFNVKIIDCAEMPDEEKETLEVIVDNFRIYINYNEMLKYKPTEEEIKNKCKYSPKIFTHNAITLSNDIQLIIRFYGTPEKIHSNFDFVHTMCYWTPDNELILPAEALESILSKQLIYRGSKYPFSSIIRTKKFIRKGWNINAGQYLKMALQLNLLNLTDMRIFSDQILGVDLLYFINLLEKMKQNMNEDKIIKIDNMIITKMIDEVFD